METIFFVSERDNCQSNPCDNGGTCHNVNDSYICKCLPEYKGDNCDEGIDC